MLMWTVWGLIKGHGGVIEDDWSSHIKNCPRIWSLVTEFLDCFSLSETKLNNANLSVIFNWQCESLPVWYP